MFYSPLLEQIQCSGEKRQNFLQRSRVPKNSKDIVTKSECLSICVPKDLANCWDDMIPLYSEASYRSCKGLFWGREHPQSQEKPAPSEPIFFTYLLKLNLKMRGQLLSNPPVPFPTSFQPLPSPFEFRAP